MTNRMNNKMPILILAMVLIVGPRGMISSTTPSSEETSRTDLIARFSGFRSLCDHGQLIQGLRVGCITKFPKFKKTLLMKGILGVLFIHFSLF